MGKPESGPNLTTNRVTTRDLNEFGRVVSSLYHQYDSLSLPKEGNAIRLLSIAPADDYYADIECELLLVNLDERPVYKTLSYAWGDPGFTLPIFINGKSHRVTANCHAALLRLRETGERCMWIDAICINRKDDDEKSTQVALMRDIYHFANEVIVWLGPAQADRNPDDEPDERLALAIINSFPSEPFTNATSFLEFAENFAEEKSWARVNKLFKHPWFLRLWAHQEYTVALKVKALLQYHSVEFDVIAECASNLQNALALGDWEQSLDSQPWPRELFETVIDVVQRTFPRSEYDRDQRLLRDTGLFQLMTITHRCKFLILETESHAGSVGDKESQINYSQSLAQVYTEITWVIISQYQSLQPLCFGRLEDLDSMKTAEFPSWVFDWRTGRQNLVQQLYCASVNRPANVSFDRNSLALQTYGMKVENIIHACEFSFDASNATFGAFLSIADWLSKAEGLGLWKRQFATYPGGHDPMDIWFRMITADVVRVKGSYCRLDDKALQKLKTIFGTDIKLTAGAQPADEPHRMKHLFKISESFAEAVQRVSKVFENKESRDRLLLDTPPTLLTAFWDRRAAIDYTWDRGTTEMLKALYVDIESRDDQQKHTSADNMELKWEQWETTLRLAEAARRTVLGRKFFLSSLDTWALGLAPSRKVT